MKSYTDLEQSKVLTEILPPESADYFWIIGHLHTDGPRYEIVRPRNEVSEPENYWPCWSLVALLDYLKQHYYVRLDHDGISWSITCVEHNTGEECTSDSFDDPVDACWGMILRLNEEK